MEIDAIYVNLKILSRVRSYNRLSTKQQYFHIVGPADGLVPLSIRRWWFCEGRDDCIQKIQELYLAARDLFISDKITGEEKTRLHAHVLESLNGLVALQKTYEADPTTVSKLDVLAESAKSILQGEDVNMRLTSVHNSARLGVVDLGKFKLPPAHAVARSAGASRSVYSADEDHSSEEQ
jgi:hypothetical protein